MFYSNPSTLINNKIKKDYQFSNAKRNFNWLNFCRKTYFSCSKVKFSVVK